MMMIKEQQRAVTIVNRLLELGNLTVLLPFVEVRIGAEWFRIIESGCFKNLKTGAVHSGGIIKEWRAIDSEIPTSLGINSNRSAAATAGRPSNAPKPVEREGQAPGDHATRLLGPG